VGSVRRADLSKEEGESYPVARQENEDEHDQEHEEDEDDRAPEKGHGLKQPREHEPNILTKAGEEEIYLLIIDDENVFIM